MRISSNGTEHLIDERILDNYGQKKKDNSDKGYFFIIIINSLPRPCVEWFLSYFYFYSFEQSWRNIVCIGLGFGR